MRRIIVFSVVLLMGCCLLSAFPSSKKSVATAEPAPAVEIIVETVAEPSMEEAEPTVAEPSAEAQQIAELESDLLKMSETLKSLQKEIDSTKLMTSGKKDEIDTLVGAIASDVETVLLDLEEKDAIIAELAQSNANQADQLAYLQGKYDNAMSSKFYADFGGAIGFKESSVMWGFATNFGIKFGSGLKIGTGLNYLVGTIGGKPSWDWSLNNVTAEFTVGWEW